MEGVEDLVRLTTTAVAVALAGLAVVGLVDRPGASALASLATAHAAATLAVLAPAVVRRRDDACTGTSEGSRCRWWP